jgi:hypothetical protein
LRAGARIAVYLDAPPPEGDPIPAPAYYFEALRAMGEAENVRVRNDGESEAAAGWEALVRRHAELAAELRERLSEEPPDRKLAVFGGYVMNLDDYLETRIVELLVHTDDLAVSAGVEPPDPPEAAAEIAIRHLVDVARLTNGDRKVLMALSRRERDEEGALRVF